VRPRRWGNAGAGALRLRMPRRACFVAAAGEARRWKLVSSCNTRSYAYRIGPIGHTHPPNHSLCNLTRLVACPGRDSVDGGGGGIGQLSSGRLKSEICYSLRTGGSSWPKCWRPWRKPKSGRVVLFHTVKVASRGLRPYQVFSWRDGRKWLCSDTGLRPAANAGLDGSRLLYRCGNLLSAMARERRASSEQPRGPRQR